MSQTLGQKEQSLFQQVAKHYENKQHKRGLKVADQLLKKVPDHGNTLAMKALILNAMGQKEEAFALGKTALRNDMKSHICWHVYGLLYKDERNFEESLKAYRFALKIKPDSSDIQRDLAHLQIQIRDFTGYIQSRRAMLKVQPTLRSNWTGLAVAQHLAGDLEDAEKTLSMYEDILKVPPPKTDIEHQQALLYKNMVIAETGNYERALEHLDAIIKHVYDKQLAMELRAEYLLKLERFTDAEKIYRILINRNQENRSYLTGLAAALQLSESQPDKLAEMYSEIASKYSRADAPRRIPLDFLKGEEFHKAADDYLRRMLTKGVPSTFSNIKTLYQDPEKQAVIEKLVLSYAKGQALNGTTDEKAAKAQESFHSSVLYFLAQHYNYHSSQDLSAALRYIDQLIEEDPKSVDYSMIKARILKSMGDTKAAAQMMDQARSLDERDRYINTKSAKYQLRNNDHAKAIEIMGKFIKVDAAGGPLGEMVEMQYVWFLTEDGEAYLRERKLGLALKRFNTIYNIFDLWQEDQFDFHSYALRRRQIRAYIHMIRWEDQLRSHPLFTRAAIAACKAYILLHDQPQLAKDEPLVNGTSADGKAKKKAAQKVKKEQEKTEAEADKKGKVIKKDLDPEGKQLLETKEPLKDAMKFLTSILESSPKSVPVQEVGFEVFLRRKKYLLALRCLLATKNLAPGSPHLHSQVLRLQHAIQNVQTPLDAKITKILDNEFKPLLPASTTDLNAVNEEFLHKNDGIQSVLAAVHVRQVLNPDANRTQAIQDLVKAIKQDSTSLRSAQVTLDLLNHWHLDTSSYVTAAHERWPQATAFAAS